MIIVSITSIIFEQFRTLCIFNLQSDGANQCVRQSIQYTKVEIIKNLIYYLKIEKTEDEIYTLP